MKNGAKWPLVASAAAAAAVYADNQRICVTNYTVKSPKLPLAFHGYKIVQISDLHGKCFGEGNSRLLGAVRRQNPDLVAVTGDLVSSRKRAAYWLFGFLKELASEYPVVFVPGNHEQKTTKNRYEKLICDLKLQYVKCLDNEKTVLKRGSEEISLYGLTIPLHYYHYLHDPSAKDCYLTDSAVAERLGPCGQDAFSVLLAHNPLYFPSYAKWGADLTLAGHMHGGSVRLPGGGGLLSPEREFFPRYCSGKFTFRGKTMIVSRGLGDSLGIRLFNPPELPAITLRKEQENGLFADGGRPVRL